MLMLLSSKSQDQVAPVCCRLVAQRLGMRWGAHKLVLKSDHAHVQVYDALNNFRRRENRGA